jgi:putative ABC transport system ATP-binding protein
MLEVVDVSKQYPTPNGPLTVLDRVNLALRPGDAAAIMGPSGSGKSTLLYILGALEPPTAGSVAGTQREIDPIEHGQRAIRSRILFGDVDDFQH